MSMLKDEDPDAFLCLTCLPPEWWHTILEKDGPAITKHDTEMCLALEPGLKLAVTLCYLATGEIFRSLAPTESPIAPLSSLFLKYAKPSAKPSKMKLCHCLLMLLDGTAQQVNLKENGTCPTVIDGKHIAINKPLKSGTAFFNYKKFSIILLAERAALGILKSSTTQI